MVHLILCYFLGLQTRLLNLCDINILEVKAPGIGTIFPLSIAQPPPKK